MDRAQACPQNYVYMLFIDRNCTGANTERVSRVYIQKRRARQKQLLEIYQYVDREHKSLSSSSSSSSSGANKATQQVARNANCKARSILKISTDPIEHWIKINRNSQKPSSGRSAASAAASARKAAAADKPKRTLMAMCIGPCQSYLDAKAFCDEWTTRAGQPKCVEHMVPFGLALAKERSLEAMIDLDAVYGTPASLPVADEVAATTATATEAAV